MNTPTIICECAYCESELHPQPNMVVSGDALRKRVLLQCISCRRMNRVVARESKGNLIIIVCELTINSETLEASDMTKAFCKALTRRYTGIR